VTLEEFKQMEKITL